MSLDKIREEIDIIDDKIYELFEERMRLSTEVAKEKKDKKLALSNKSREREILSRVSGKSEELKTYTRMLYNTLFSLSKSYQTKLLGGDGSYSNKLEEAIENSPRLFPNSGTIAVQGTEGAYSQQACDKMFPMGDIMYFKTFGHVFDAVNNGLCDFGILPIENSSNGSVKEVYDLMLEKNFSIVRSYKLYVKHVLLAKEGVKMSNITEVVSHPQALDQCSEFLKDNPEIRITYFSNTAAAAKFIAESDRDDIAAISSKYCADLYGLEIISDDIQNSDNNYTRFICITKDLTVYPGSGKVSLMLTAPHEPGGLFNIMSRFAALGLNITKLESRPIPGTDFEFMFYFDFEGSIESEDVRELIDDFDRNSDKFAFLGNYQEQ